MLALSLPQSETALAILAIWMAFFVVAWLWLGGDP